MTENTVPEGESSKDERIKINKQETSFHYQMAEMKARKMVTLIKFSKLNYFI
jgi:hypothetical protein